MTPFVKKKDIKNDWYIVNAENLVVGRLAAYISKVLRGKNKSTFNPNQDNGDFVIVTNVEKIKLSGKKFENKKYYKHTGYPGGIKERKADKILEGRFPDRVIRKAVERMVPRGPLGRQVMRQLYIYSGSNHPHEAQSPVTLDVKSMNRKNS